MYLTVSFEILIEDNAVNAPEVKKNAIKIIVKIPRDSSFKSMVQKIAVQNSNIMHRVVTLYYYGKNGNQN